MRNAVIGLIIGIVAGIVLGSTLIAPKLNHAVKLDNGQTVEAEAPRKSQIPLAKAEVPAENKSPRATSLRINMASAYGENLASHGNLAKRLERTVWRISDGTLDLRFHPPGAMVADSDAFNAVVSGAIDAYFTDLDSLAELNPALSLFAGPPFGASVAAYLGWMADGGGQHSFETSLSEMGLDGAVCGMVPNAGGGWFRKPVITVDDLKGLKIRSTGITATLYRAMGAEVSGFSYGETLAAMESGLLDAAELSAPNVDLALGAAHTGWTYYVPGWRTPAQIFVLLMAKDKWQGLSTIQRTQITTACGDNVSHAIAQSETLQFEALKKIVAKGVDVRPWPAEIKEAMRNAWLDGAKELQQTNRSFAKVMKSYRTFIKGQSIWEELSRR